MHDTVSLLNNKVVKCGVHFINTAISHVFKKEGRVEDGGVGNI